MRKLSLLTASTALALLPLLSAKADDGAKVYYKDGTNIETADLDLKIKFELQTRFAFTDIDGGEDTTGFDLNRVRVAFSGNLLDKQFSYKIETDLAADTGGSDLKDAWFQFNNDGANVKVGQFKVPFSRQEAGSSGQLEFVDTSLITQIFAPSRQVGAQVNGALDGGINYAIGTYNGESDGEGRNRGPVDNMLAYYAALNASTDGYGSRASEGDLRENNSGTDFTGGAAAIYGEGNNDAVDTKRFDLNVDLGARSGGMSAQTEFYYSNIDVDQVSGSTDLFGFYAQAGYLLDKNWEVAGRFGYFSPDDDDAIDTVDEYSLVLNYYLKGHSLKLQNQVTFADTSFNDDTAEDTTDFRYEAQLAGLF